MSLTDNYSLFNNTTDQLAPDAEFVGQADVVQGFTHLYIHITTDRKLTLAVEYGDDGKTWTVGQAFLIKDRGDVLRTTRLNSKYCRVRCRNADSTETKTLRILTAFSKFADARFQCKYKPLRTMAPRPDTENTFTSFSVNPRGALYVAPPLDPETNTSAHVAPSGALTTVQPVPILRAAFSGSDEDAAQWTSARLTTGSITHSPGVATLATGTDPSGACTFVSRVQSVSAPDQVAVFQTNISCAALQPNLTQCWGLLSKDRRDGFYFLTDGIRLCVAKRCAGVETRVSQSNFNGTPVDLPAFNCAYRIQYSAGRAIFQCALAGNALTLHDMGSDGAGPLITNYSLGFYFHVENVGATSNSAMHICTASIALVGTLPALQLGSGTLKDATPAPVRASVMMGRRTKDVYGPLALTSAGCLLTQDISVHAYLDPDTSSRSVYALSGALNIKNTSEPLVDLDGAHPSYFYGGQAATPAVLSIRSSDREDADGKDGAHVVHLTGLKTAISTVFESEMVTLKGTSTVQTVHKWFRIIAARCAKAGPVGANKGTITIGLCATIEPLDGEARLLSFTIPAGSRGLVRHCQGSVNGRSGKNNDGGRLQLRAKAVTQSGRGHVKSISVIGNGCPGATMLPQSFSGPADLRLCAAFDGVKNISVYAMMEITLIPM